MLAYLTTTGEKYPCEQKRLKNFLSHVKEQLILVTRLMLFFNSGKLTWTTSETLVAASSSISDSNDDTYSAGKNKNNTF